MALVTFLHAAISYDWRAQSICSQSFEHYTISLASASHGEFTFDDAYHGEKKKYRLRISKTQISSLRYLVINLYSMAHFCDISAAICRSIPPEQHTAAPRAAKGAEQCAFCGWSFPWRGVLVACFSLDSIRLILELGRSVTIDLPILAAGLTALAPVRHSILGVILMPQWRGALVRGAARRAAIGTKATVGISRAGRLFLFICDDFFDYQGLAPPPLDAIP